jgi:hypothetical protein
MPDARPLNVMVPELAMPVAPAIAPVFVTPPELLLRPPVILAPPVTVGVVIVGEDIVPLATLSPLTDVLVNEPPLTLPPVNVPPDIVPPDTLPPESVPPEILAPLIVLVVVRVPVIDELPVMLAPPDATVSPVKPDNVPVMVELPVIAMPPVPWMLPVPAFTPSEVISPEKVGLLAMLRELHVPPDPRVMVLPVPLRLPVPLGQMSVVLPCTDVLAVEP